MNRSTRLPVHRLNTIKDYNRKESLNIRDISKHQVIILVSSVGDSSIASDAKEVSALGSSFD